ncbi:hypothetical protein [Azohydromonas lata]|uniref:hypothetical protein n=1 Tax=Azohydromonas lata TaxID=45677 RepID=UPI00082C7608|nr:hypothetical protein [Azohydromonas lata]
MNHLPEDDEHWLDEALDAPLLPPPADFTERVMAALPPPAVPPSPVAQARQRAARWLKALALAAGGTAGLAQALSFAWGLWTATTLGAG